MPKGKPKRDNPTLYKGSPEPSESGMVRQAASHRRGGTHKVRDEHKTDSEYDAYNYKELVDKAKERGIYRKDMKKVEMAWALKHDDEKKKRAERDAMLALQRRQQEAKEEQERIVLEKQRQIEEKHERHIEKKRKRDRDESVSDDTLSDADIEAQETTRNEYARENFGHALSDESWDSTSTESSSTTSFDPSAIINPACKLRLLEWPHEKLPSDHPPLPGYFSFFEPKPRLVPYAPLKLVTTHSKQKLVLPGAKYPVGVDPDYCPILSPTTRRAARNGHLTGTLHHAVIEPGVDWAKNTLVQGWNATMYFHPPSRNEIKGLADTYQKWFLENRKLLRVKGKGVVGKEERGARHVARRRNRVLRTVEVYESCAWRPGGMGFVGAYLNWGDGRGGERKEEGERVLENLFFIRFPGCDVPHYYFWTREGEWGNPCFPNPAWDAGEVNEEGENHMQSHEHGDESRAERWQLASPERTRKSYKSRKTYRTRIRIRKPSLGLPSTPPPPPNTFPSTTPSIEHHLYTHGLAQTLSHYRAKWLSNGKTLLWKKFAANLPTLWPSGCIPRVPPVEGEGGSCVAEKIAVIEGMSGWDKSGEEIAGSVSLLRGGEAWTRGDGEWWGVGEVEVEGDEGSGEDEDEDDEKTDGSLEEIGYQTNDEALYRRSSVISAQDQMVVDPVVAWLDQISPAYSPPITPLGVPKVVMGLEKWEEKYLLESGNENSGYVD
ncbi:hypothetical protein G6011_06723 [Alternaria panax]|uniref:Uncharacterized protein n=1 Tax=Alternaria panax TaxID=48097 RepID=A0AAD4I5R1_9PLEO|nr:hypothetical protein G6011_06723 [Alternaria panax]